VTHPPDPTTGPAAQDHATHFRLTVNLGTAWHLHGDLAQAEAPGLDALKVEARDDAVGGEPEHEVRVVAQGPHQRSSFIPRPA
jgi:hypothetical protein